VRTVRRTHKADVTVVAPASKAHTLRAFFLGALADGESTIRNPLMGDDQRHAMDCLRALGAGVVADGDRIVVQGCGGWFKPVSGELDVGESGVSMNCLTALACLSANPVIITGGPRLVERPVGELVGGLRQLGCGVECLGQEGYPPVKVHGGGMPGGAAELRGDLTSQYFSAILLAAPYADRPVTLRCLGPMSEKPYVAITLEMMARFGVEAEHRDLVEFTVPNERRYGACAVEIEGDYSSASFFFEAAAVCGSRVTVTGLDPGSVQGDRRFLDLLEPMGCHVARMQDGWAVQGRKLAGIDADMADTPDLVPPLAVTAAFSEGTTRLTGIAHLSQKESDRPAVIASGLRKMGVDVSWDGSALHITGGQPRGALIDPHNDHRIAMSFAVAALAVGDQIIEDEACVAKSFPDFWDRLAAFY